MSAFAKINNNDGSLVEIVNQPEDWSPSLEGVAGKYGPDKPQRWVPVAVAAEPSFDSATHHLERSDALVGDEWVQGWVVVVNPVPLEVPLWAFRACLALRGLADQVLGLIATLPEPSKTVAHIQWDYANYIRRDHPVIEQLAPALGLSGDDLDAIFRQASLLA